MIDKEKVAQMVQRCKRSEMELEAARCRHRASAEGLEAAGREYGEAHVALQDYLKEATGIPTLGSHRA